MEEFTLGADTPTYFSEDADHVEAMEQKLAEADPQKIGQAVRSAAKAEAKEDVVYTQTEEQKEHQIAMMKLSRFGSSPRWSSYLKAQGFGDLQSMSKLRKLTIEELNDLLTRCTTACMCRGNDQFFVRSFLTGVGAVETCVANSPLKDKILLSGLREVCAKDDVLLDALSIFEITHNVTAGSPMVMLMYTAFSACAKTHALNTFLRHRMDAGKNLEQSKEECSEPTNSSTNMPEASSTADPQSAQAGRRPPASAAAAPTRSAEAKTDSSAQTPTA